MLCIDTLNRPPTAFHYYLFFPPILLLLSVSHKLVSIHPILKHRQAGHILTSRRPLLLRCALPSRLGNLQMLQPIFLLIIIYLPLRICSLQIRKRRYPPRVVCCECGATESLAQDFVAESFACRVEDCVEDAALDLGVVY